MGKIVLAHILGIELGVLKMESPPLLLECLLFNGIQYFIDVEAFIETLKASLFTILNNSLEEYSRLVFFNYKRNAIT